MSMKAYEDSCMRAELFGQPKPNKEEFLEKNKHLDVVEFEDVDIKTAEKNAILNNDLRDMGGVINDMNAILASTQTKVNRLKRVCGSVTNFFRLSLATKDNLSYSSEQSYVGQKNFDYDAQSDSDLSSVNQGLGPGDNEMTSRAAKSKNGGDINTALANLKSMQDNEDTSLILKENCKQVSSQISKLDNIILQADKAEESLKSQNKQMRSFLR